ncbi:MAG: hypothetical protein VX981_07395 [Chloroflexota bacterium]|nr:hypothetical protein [Chloroflexota bacterium]
MFLIRRVCKVERKDSWQVAKLLKDICDSYEENTGRGKATIYIGGAGTPADEFTVCAEWMQETIDANRMPNVPQSVLDANAEMFPLITDYKIEFFEIATEEKFAERF